MNTTTTPLVNRIEIEGAIAAGFVQLPNGSWDHPARAAAMVANRKAREAARAAKAKHVLSLTTGSAGIVTVTFTTLGDGVRVRTAVKDSAGNQRLTQVKMAIEDARREYKRLLVAGYAK